MWLRRIASARRFSESPISPNICLPPIRSSAPTRTSATVFDIFGSQLPSSPYFRARPGPSLNARSCHDTDVSFGRWLGRGGGEIDQVRARRQVGTADRYAP